MKLAAALIADELATDDLDEELTNDDFAAEELNSDDFATEELESEDLEVKELAADSMLSEPLGGCLAWPPPQPLTTAEKKITARAEDLK